MAKYQKGESGNPNGRPRGRPDKRTQFKEALQDRAAELMDKAIEVALSGDVAALKLCIDKIIPAAKDLPVTDVKLDGGGLTERAEAIYSAVTAGELTPSQGSDLMNLLAASSRIRVDDKFQEQEALYKPDYGKLAIPELETLKALLIKAGDNEMG